MSADQTTAGSTVRAPMNKDPATAVTSRATDTTVPTTARLGPRWGRRPAAGAVADGVGG